MRRGRLPLTALRTFEAAGRHQNFTVAAEELFITQAAVSRQIRELEGLLGQQLFVRLHRKVVLTSIGENLLTVLTRSFDNIDDALRAANRSVTTTPLKISVEPSFAGSWLIGHLSAFQREHPEINVIVESERRLIDFTANQPQIAIRHSEDTEIWPRSEARRLFSVHLIAAISPQFRNQGPAINCPSDLLGRSLLHEAHYDVWARWFEAAGVHDAHPSRGMVYADGGLVQQAIVHGQGIGLVDEFIARDDLLAGRMKRLFEHSLRYGSYFVVARSFELLSAPAAAFVAWLCTAIDASESQPCILGQSRSGDQCLSDVRSTSTEVGGPAIHRSS